MEYVFYLQHTIDYGDRLNRKGIGTFRSQSDAMRAMSRVVDQPGFRDPRGWFNIHRCIVGRDYYPQGLDAGSQGREPVASGDEPLAPGTMLEQLFLLYNESNQIDIAYDNDFVLLGYFSSKDAAEQAMVNLQNKPEFLRPDREFGISTSTVGGVSWLEGFGGG
jgi:hypothetical protein